MRRARRALETALVLLGLSLLPAGCVKATLSSQRFAERERHDVWLHRYLYGLVGQRELDTRRYCAHGAARLRVAETGSSLALSILTLGVYTPEVARITCGVEVSAGPAGSGRATP
jgi:Bor protein